MLKTAVATLATSLAGGGEPAFEGHSEPIRGAIKERIVGSSWRPGCPVHHSKLRLLELTHLGFDGDVHRGRLIVHYGADDRRSMKADNTSAFNCRFVAGTTRWSMHAYGKAIDLNPIENPYVSGSHVSPPAGEPFADRSREAA